MKIAIDAGHGMGNTRRRVYDPGAVRRHDGVLCREADFNLAYALALKHYCVKAGIPFFLTRAGEKSPCHISRRSSRAKKAGCTHLISFHVNAAKGSASGMETLYRNIKDVQFARQVHGAVQRGTEFRDRGLKQDREYLGYDLAVLKFDGPACLVELGFINNPREVKRLSARGTRICVATEIVEKVLKAL